MPEEESDLWIVEVHLRHPGHPTDSYKTELFVGDKKSSVKLYKQLRDFKGKKLVLIMP